MTLYSIVVLSRYEYFHTSQLMSIRENRVEEIKARKTSEEREWPRITFQNLASFFIFLLCLNVGWIFVLGIELMQYGKLRNCVALVTS